MVQKYIEFIVFIIDLLLANNNYVKVMWTVKLSRDFLAGQYIVKVKLQNVASTFTSSRIIIYLTESHRLRIIFVTVTSCDNIHFCIRKKTKKILTY